jgi:murein L,D-transpeptidase YcbB/YkuD
VEEIIRAKGIIPHHLPGTNTFLKEYQEKHGIPADGAMGGAETLYPEYRSKEIAEQRAAAKK